MICKSYKLKAVSLLEVTVVLLLAATVLIIAARVSAGYLVQIKNNEITDFTNTVLLQAVEVAKSPDEVVIIRNIETSEADGSYSFDVETNVEGEAETFLRYQGNDITEIAECTGDSAYLVDLALGSAPESDAGGDVGLPESDGAALQPDILPGALQTPICLQLLVENQAAENEPPIYLMTAVAVTQISGDYFVNSLQSYRLEQFDIRVSETL